MKIDKKHMGLILVSFIALSFNSHFAQAAKKTKEILQPSKVYAFKKTERGYTPLTQIKDSSIVVKKTGVRIDRKNIYIGGYIVNTSKKAVQQVRVYPTFVSIPNDFEKLSYHLNHDELNIAPSETRRFVIMRPISDVKALLENNIPIAENCILNCRVL